MVIATTPFEFATSIQAAGLLDPEGLLKGFGGLALFAACMILFIECGLLIGLVLPGDSLLFIVGLFLASGFIDTPLWLAIFVLSIAAILGNLLGYWTGAKFGPKLFARPDSRIFKQEYVVITQNFFEKHGPRAIVLARFVPIVRPVITGMAGVARMNYRIYATYSTIGGILWVVSLTLVGYFFGSIQIVKDNIELATIGIVLLSLVPVAVEIIKHRRKR
ncbi:MAG: VTT domain-containing protein [Candidatus Nanopelagicales bacterium]|jgi:membrane-associated protein|nr:VTT domain-containing protein [Candidatus Nanopelagicales bacterium]MDP5050674.1 VTT domain-containing protein [Candidatus Nanopelagicales bacterium]